MQFVLLPFKFYLWSFHKCWCSPPINACFRTIIRSVCDATKLSECWWIRLSFSHTHTHTIGLWLRQHSRLEKHTSFVHSNSGNGIKREYSIFHSWSNCCNHSRIRNHDKRKYVFMYQNWIGIINRTSWIAHAIDTSCIFKMCDKCVRKR